jgi:hypothetical protein
MEVTVCVPVLKRYDLLQGLVHSLNSSEARPGRLLVIDNGRDRERLAEALSVASFPVLTHLPMEAMGVAESWNWFIMNTEGERVITNDDVVFAPETLGKLAGTEGDLVFAAGCGFSCFLIRDTCVEKLGFFDETISPGYGYYEDEDYLQRLDGKGTKPRAAIACDVKCGAQHLKSQTLAASTHAELNEHHRRFRIARRNYMTKWNLEAL